MTENFTLQVDNLKIAGKLFPPAKQQGLSPVLCICHGIPAEAHDPTNTGYADLARTFAQNGFITCTFNFRGAGESEGNLDLLDWTRDLAAVITHLSRLEGADNQRISVMGFSGGAAASAYTAASDNRISSLVLCACPADFSVITEESRLKEFLDHCREIGSIKDPGFPTSVLGWTNHFHEVNPINHIEKIAPRPLLIVHGDKDDLIPLSHAEELYVKAGQPKELVVIPEGGHRLRSDEMAMNATRIWLKKINGII